MYNYKYILGLILSLVFIGCTQPQPKIVYKEKIKYIYMPCKEQSINSIKPTAVI